MNRDVCEHFDPISLCEKCAKSNLPPMQLVDYFAAKAIIGLLSCPIQNQSGADMYARDAYEIARAMIKARSMP